MATATEVRGSRRVEIDEAGIRAWGEWRTDTYDGFAAIQAPELPQPGETVTSFTGVRVRKLSTRFDYDAQLYYVTMYCDNLRRGATESHQAGDTKVRLRGRLATETTDVDINGDALPKSVDVLVPQAVLEVSCWYADGREPSDAECWAIIGKVNDAVWRGNAADSWLLTDFTKEQIADSLWQIDWEWALNKAGSGWQYEYQNSEMTVRTSAGGAEYRGPTVEALGETYQRYERTDFDEVIWP